MPASATRMAGAKPRRHAAHRLDVHHAWQVRDVVDARRAERGSTKVTVASCRMAQDELPVDQHVHDVDERQADEQHGDREGDADDRRQRDRTGCRSRLRRTMRVAMRQTQPAPRAARTGCGGSGPAAPAASLRPAGSRTARRTADWAPSARDDQADRRARRSRRRATADSRARESGRTRCRCSIIAAPSHAPSADAGERAGGGNHAAPT